MFGYHHVGPDRIFLWQDSPEPSTTSCGHLCLMAPKKEALTNPKSRHLSLNVAVTRAARRGKKKKRMNGALRDGNKQEGTPLKMTQQSNMKEKNPNLGEMRHATVGIPNKICITRRVWLSQMA